MSKLIIPEGYTPPLPHYELQRAIAFIKDSFQTNLSNALNLRRVSAPLFVKDDSGLNDNLNGVERPVNFDIPDVGIHGGHVEGNGPLVAVEVIVQTGLLGNEQGSGDTF